ncbi:MAG: hypothetical protein IJO16_07450 [Clostridia bacterium]|nr:hypothetical protein [Clostridia bacterium]
MKLRKAMLALVCALALVVGSVMGTMAYLTSTTETVTNTFTVGKVGITLDEAKVTEYGVKDGDTRVIANTYKLVPGHTYVKDPTVHVANDAEASYLFVKVVDEIAAIEDKTTVADQMTTNGWVELEGVDNVYYLNRTVDKTTGDVKVFENFKVKGDADVAAYAGKTITVVAYAVQADGFANAAAAWAAAPSTWTVPATPAQ